MADLSLGVGFCPIYSHKPHRNVSFLETWTKFRLRAAGVLVELTRWETLIQHLFMQISQASASSDFFLERHYQHCHPESSTSQNRPSPLGEGCCLWGHPEAKICRSWAWLWTQVRKEITRRTRGECRTGHSTIVPCSTSSFHDNNSLCSFAESPWKPERTSLTPRPHSELLSSTAWLNCK